MQTTNLEEERLQLRVMGEVRAGVISTDAAAREVTGVDGSGRIGGSAAIAE